jgi:signal transduction histidine kinase
LFRGLFSKIRQDQKEENQAVSHFLQIGQLKLGALLPLLNLKKQMNKWPLSETEKTFLQDNLEHALDTLEEMVQRPPGLIQNTQEKAPVSIGLILKKCCHLMAPLADDRDITLIQDIPDGIYARALAPELTHLLEILLHNAITHSRPQSSVVISANIKECRRTKDTNENFVEIRFSNEGAEFTTAKIKEMFLQKNQSRGIPLAKRLADMHQGNIWAENSEGRNTVYLAIGAAIHKTTKSAA